MVKKIKIISLLLIYILTLQQGVITVYAADSSSGQIYVTPLNAASLNGYSTGSQQSFEIESYWTVNTAKVNLVYEVSPLMQNERSSVTLILNGTPFYSFRPVINETAHQHLTIEIPNDLIVKGSNFLTIEGFLQTSSPVTNQMCVPTESRDKWLQIYDTSTVVVDYTPAAMKSEIRDFNSHFLGRDVVNRELNTIVIPEDHEAIEMEAAVYALSGIAKANPLKDQIIPLTTYNSINLKDKQAIVFISLFNHLPTEIKAKLKQGNWENEALIQLVHLGNQSVLVVTSSNPELLVKAGRLLANQTLLQQLHEDSKIVTGTTDVNSPPVSISRTLNLTETGDKLTGALHREKTYFISLPGNRSIADASKISLDFRYSSNLDFERSLVTVLINNSPIGSKKLTAVLADGDSLQLPIPKNLDISGNFSITVAFDLELLNASCVQNQDQMPWAFVAKDSLLQVNTNDKAELLFNNYPYPFLRDGSFNQIAVVLPSHLDTYTYKAIANLFNLLGQYAVTNTGEVRIVAEHSSANQLKDHQIISIGTFQNNKTIRDNNDKLFFQYDKNGSTFISNEKMSIDSSYGKLIGTIQLIESPYAAGHGMLAVTGASTESIYMASKLLKTDSTMWKVFGDGVVTDIDNKIHAFRFKKELIQQEPSVLAEVLNRSDVIAFMTAAVLVLFLILLSLILMIRKYRLKRRREH